MTDEPLTAEDETGWYWFENVARGSYLVREVLQVGWTRIQPTLAVNGYTVNVIAGQEFNDRHFGNLNLTPAATLDFGDAPGGAKHETVGPLLGDTRDVDDDGQPSAGGDGDDLNNDGDDEDGISFLGSLVQGQQTELEVAVAGRAPTPTSTLGLTLTETARSMSPKSTCSSP